jgi:hypothetical protein
VRSRVETDLRVKMGLVQLKNKNVVTKGGSLKHRTRSWGETTGKRGQEKEKELVANRMAER